MNDYNKALLDVRSGLSRMWIKYAQAKSKASGAGMDSAAAKLGAKIRTIKEAMEIIDSLKKARNG